MISIAQNIEIHADNKDFRFGYDAVGPTVFAIDTGIYACYLTLMTEILAKIQVTYAAAQCYLTADHKIAFDHPSASSSITLDFLDNDLGVLLGFYQEGTLSKPAVADYAPPSVWLPTRENSNTSLWRPLNDYKGKRAVNGQVSGISLTNDRYQREFTFPAEPDTNVFISRGTETESFGGSTYYPDSKRSIQQWIKDIRALRPTTDTNGIPMTGAYIIHDRTVYEGTSPTVAIPSSMDSGGVRSELSSSPDRFVYATLDPGADIREDPTIDDRPTFQDVEMSFQTATAPTWLVP